jgi:hypothetical protein
MTAVNFYRRMLNGYVRSNKFAPEVVEAEMETLGELIASFAPFVDSSDAPFDESQLPKVKEYQANLPKVQRLFSLLGARHLFVYNGLDTVLKMAGNSLKTSSDKGDEILLAICNLCGAIADKVVAGK